ncbi:MAG: hypothetical protein ABJ308_15665 [Halieaceae bacterium]
MEKQIERARELLPSIIITVLSMIQALALELYWNRLQNSELLWHGGWPATLGWLQMMVMLLGILQIWVMYVSLMLRFRWMPSMEDTLVPFGIGLLEFGMIDLMGPEHLGPWFVALAAVFALSVGAIHKAHRRARQDPENEYFFGNVAPASWRDYIASLVAVSTIAAFGVLLWWSEDRSALALAALLFALAALLYQFKLSRYYWMHTLVDGIASNEDPQ